MKPNKTMSDLQRLLATQDFKNEEELNEFLKKYQSEGIPEFPSEVLNNKEKAEDKIFEAYNSSKTKGLKLAEEALRLDDHCILAYQYLGEQQNNISKAQGFFEKGIEIGKQEYGGAFEKEHKGHFWMIHETRPYLSCIFNLAECFQHSSRISKGIKLLEWLLVLNEGDNQGVRYILSSYLLEAEEYQKFEKHSKAFADDAGIFFRFNNALYEFIKSGISMRGNMYLDEAIKYNQFVVSQLNKQAKLNSSSYSLGSKEEASYYCIYNAKIWQNVEGAIKWAKQMNK